MRNFTLRKGFLESKCGTRSSFKGFILLVDMSIMTTSIIKPLKELRVPHLLSKNPFLKVKFLIILYIKLHFLYIYKRQSLNYYIILEISFPYFRNDFKFCLFGQRFFFSIFPFKSTTIFRNMQENRGKVLEKVTGKGEMFISARKI